MKHRKTVAIIPAFNEEKTIKKIVSAAGRYVDEVIVVDDGSKDNTARLALSAGAYVHRHSKNFAYGEAIKTGLHVALQRGAAAAVILDGDGQHDPEYIPLILHAVFDGSADVVIASRLIKHNACIPLIRRWGIILVSKLFNWFYMSSIFDTQSGFRALSFRAMKLDLHEKGMGISVELLARALQQGFVIKEEPVPCKFDKVPVCSISLLAQALTVVCAILRSTRKYVGLCVFIRKWQ
ncbi:MAG: glycosyltransferase family 2 protein [Eubacteriales bacterium]